MQNNRLNSLIWVVVLAAIFTTGAGFDETKRNLAKYECTHFEFLSTVDSKVFDVIDSAHGIAYFANDGRYYVEVGQDVFLFDGDSLYSYFWDNNQVIIERPDSTNPVASEISFVMKLDEWYDSKSLKEKNRFRLVKKKGLKGDIPDSMIIMIDSKNALIETIEYFDINDDLNRIMILEQQADSVCRGTRFEPSFPDSVERIRI